jgi:hypothetical protein
MRPYLGSLDSSSDIDRKTVNKIYSNYNIIQILIQHKRWNKHQLPLKLKLENRKAKAMAYKQKSVNDHLKFARKLRRQGNKFVLRTNEATEHGELSTPVKTSVD